MARLICMAILGGSLLMLIGGALGAQEQTARIIPQRQAAIKLGQRIDDAIGILREQRIEPSEAVYQEVGGNPDDASITFTLDNEHANARLFYSKSKKVINGISIIYRPRMSGRRDHFSLSAQSIVLERDGSYLIHFAPPSKR